MSLNKLFGSSQQNTFVEPTAVPIPAAATIDTPSVVAEVATGASTDSSAAELRRRYRPGRSSSLGSSGTGLSV